MHAWITQVLRERREEAGISLRDMETMTGVDRGNLSRFERGLARAVRDFDGIVEGYANALGVDAIELWRDALDRWQASLKPAATQPRRKRRMPRTRSA